MFRSTITIFTLCVLVLFSGKAHSQEILSADYAPTIPTLESVLGHKTGEKITPPAEALQYLRALQTAAPDRVIVTPYATSWQGRELVTVVISSPENMRRLDQIKSDLATLAKGEALGASGTNEIIARTPAVTWLSYGVHGDEISSTDAALALSYHLLAAKNDPIVEAILRETIVVIDPMQNPDGRARFVHSFESSLGLEPQSDRYAVEHDQPWPGGRFNHYLFDLNRDWFALSQPETRGKVKAMLEWNPVVVVDAHEMGGDSTYFFAPSAEPFNPGVTDEQRQKQTLIGQNNAKWFDKMGFEYFTREIFDQFYPGYGDMWPTLNGAIAMTYEQASAGGLKFKQSNDNEFTYLDSVTHHFVSTLSTAEVVAKNKQLFLTDFAKYRTSAVQEGRTSDGRYSVLDLGTRSASVRQLGERLVFQGVQVMELGGPRSICGMNYSKGALVIDQAQPNGRLIKTLLNPETPLPDAFIEEQEGRRDRGLAHELYDVTAWSVPLMDGLDVRHCKRVDLSSARAFSTGGEVSGNTVASASFGYAVPWTDTAQAKLVLAALKEGFVGKATDEEFEIGAQKFPRGTTIFRLSDNASNLSTRIKALAGDTRAKIIPLNSSWVDDGPNFGSSKFNYLKPPKVALAWGEGTNPMIAGATRYVIERNLGLGVTPIRVETLRYADLGDYDVVILPQTGGGFTAELGGSGAKALKTFVSNGGVLVGFGSAVNALISEDMALLSTTIEKMALSDEETDSAPDDLEDGPAPGLILEDEDAYRSLVLDRDKKPATVPGVLLNAIADPDHWLSSGYDSAVALLAGNTIYRPLNESAGTNVFKFAAADNLLASGYLWEENRQQLAFKPFVMVEPRGDGLVIAFTQTPTTRAYLNGLTLLVANAVVLGPAHTD